MKSLKIVFFGSSGYSLPSLEALFKAGYPIRAVVTLPERRGGRGQQALPNPVKDWAESHKINLLQQEKMSDAAFQEALRKLSPDLFIVVSFGKFLPASLLEIPKLYSLNLHPSLLPKFRGPSPVAWALLEGERKTGITILQINERIDAGDLLLVEEVPIEEDDDVQVLSDKLFQKGASLLLKALSVVETGKAAFLPQQEKEATYAPRLKKSDGEIDWSQESRRIARQIRAFKGWPGTHTFYQGKRLILWKADPYGETSAKGKRPGQVLEYIKGKGILVSTGEGALLLEEVQLEGKERMEADRFWTGHLLRPGETFTMST